MNIADTIELVTVMADLVILIRLTGDWQGMPLGESEDISTKCLLRGEGLPCAHGYAPEAADLGDVKGGRMDPVTQAGPSLCAVPMR